MATKTPNECPVPGGCDCVSKALCRVGIKRSAARNFGSCSFCMGRCALVR
jgi:hypothetical protein